MFSIVRNSMAAFAATGFVLAAGAGVAAAQLPPSNAPAMLPFPGDGNSFNAGVGGAIVGPISTPGIHAGPGGVDFGGGAGIGQGLPTPF